VSVTVCLIYIRVHAMYTSLSVVSELSALGLFVYILCQSTDCIMSECTSNGLRAGHQNFMSPITPAELLIALHGIDPTKVDVKTIIKGMTLLCCRL